MSATSHSSAWTRQSQLSMQLLRSGIPLTLLMDLASPNGPDSRCIIETERPSCPPVSHAD